MPRAISLVALASLAMLLAACAPEATRPPESLRQAPDRFPEASYRQLAVQGRPVFRIDPARSLLVIEVYRGGSLARVGHDHVIAAHDLQGYAAPEEGRADLYLRLDDLVVDEPGLRAEAKLETHPSEDDIAGTRRNMLNAFQAEQFPFAVIHLERGGTTAGDAPLSVALSLHGVTRTVEIPVQLSVAGDELSAVGDLSLKQTDFEIKPLSILGGALQVRDEVKVKFSIRAQRMR
jgi:YceI-like domain